MKDLTKLARRPSFWIGLTVMGMLIGLAFGVFLMPKPGGSLVTEVPAQATQPVLPLRLGLEDRSRTVGPPSTGIDERMDVVLRSQPALVRLTSFGEEGREIANGAGFFIGPQQVATSRHVVAHAHRTEAVTHGGHKLEVGDVLAADPGYDLALVSVPEMDEPVRPLTLAAGPPQKGESVIFLGPRPDEDSRITRDGVVFGVRDLRGFGTILEIGAHVSQSWTGSPVIDRRGSVVGIAMAHGLQDKDLHFAVPASTLRSLSADADEAAGLDASLAGAGTDAALADLRGVCAYLAGDLVQAARAFEAAIHANELDGTAWAYLGRCQKDLGQTERAAESLERASRIEPDDPSILLDLAIVHRGQGRRAEALTALDRAVRLAPDDAATRFVAGTEYRALSAYGRAARSLEQAWRLEPSLSAAREKGALCYCSSGVKSFESDDLDEALAAFTSSIGLNPANPNVLYNAGVCQTRREKWSAAIVLFEKAATLAPCNPNIHLALGVSHLRVGDRAGASRVLAQLRQIDGDAARRLASEMQAGNRSAPQRLALERAE